MQDEDEFYVVLPSNADPDVYPNNNASNFKVHYQNPIQFAQPNEWKVALTDMTYNQSSVTTNISQGFEYDARLESRAEITHNSKENTYNLTFLNPHPITGNFVLVEIKDGYFEFRSLLPYTVAFDSQDDATIFGFSDQKSSLDSLTYFERDFKLCAQFPHSFKFNVDLMLKTRKYLPTITVTFFPADRSMEPTKQIIFDKSHLFANADDLANYIKKEGIKAKCLHDCYYDSVRRKICFTVKTDIYKFKLWNNPNRVLGFVQDSFTCSSQKNFCAVNDPKLVYQISNMFVYASFLSPIRVGHMQVPLLKNIYIDTTKDFPKNELRNISMKHLMYLPLNVSTINSIEVNIRDDGGALAPCSEYAKTCLTLHFKRFRKI